MKNTTPGPDKRIDDCNTVVIYSDVDQDAVDAMPVTLHEEEPLAFPEPGYSCTAQLTNGQVVGLFYGIATRRLVFFPGSAISTGDRLTAEAIISESNLPEKSVSFRWDRDHITENHNPNKSLDATGDNALL